jgi:hypothetical protein
LGMATLLWFAFKFDGLRLRAFGGFIDAYEK